MSNSDTTIITEIPLPSNPRFQDLTGQSFGLWVVLSYAGIRCGNYYWRCQCECGSHPRDVHRGSLMSGKTVSCGCHRDALTIQRSTAHGNSRRKNVTPEYTTWCYMIKRCENPNDKNYSLYGGRGITVCERWRNSFTTFLEDMGQRPSPKHSIDRKNNNGNYEPENCKWSTPQEQARNKRNNRIIVFQGITATLAEHVERLGLNGSRVRSNLSRGWSEDAALSEVRG